MNKYKNLAFNTVIFAVGTFGSKILSYLLYRLYALNINEADSNTRDLLAQTANFLIPIVTLSMAEALIRYGLDKNYKQHEVFSTSVCICGFGIAGLAVLSPLFNLISYIDGYAVLLFIYICTSSIRSLCSQFVRVRNLVKLFALDGILATFTFFVFNIIFIAKLGLGVKGFMFSMILSDFCSAVFLFTIAKLWKYLNIRYFRKDVAKTMLRFSIPLIPTALMWIITGFSDRLFIRYMKSDTVKLGAGVAGIYGYAAAVPNLINMASTIVSQAWNMSAYTENDSEDRSQFYEKVYSSYQSLMFVASAFILVTLQITTPLLVPDKVFKAYSGIYVYSPFLVISSLLMCYNQFLSSIYSATHHTKNSTWTSFVACGTNIILNLILIPRFGIQGAAIATLLSYLVCYVIRIFDTRRYIPFKVNHFAFIFNTSALVALSVVLIKQPPYYIAFLVLGFLIIFVGNIQPIFETAKKLLKR